MRFPVIVFGHGYLMQASAYRNIWEWIVPRGYVLAIPESESGMFPSHLEYARDLAFVLDEMTRLGREPGSPFYGKTGTAGCLMGHSMGGGSAVLAAGMTEAAKTLLLLAPLETHPPASEAARTIDLPALVFAGTDDRVTPPEKHADRIYKSLAGRDKTYIAILGGTHCQMADYNLLCQFAETSLDPFPGISRQKQHRVLERYMPNWLDYFLRGNQLAGEAFRQALHSDPDILFETTGRPGELPCP